MSSYQAYPEYKDSGVEWLDIIPSHWTPASLKMLVDVRDGTHDTPEYVETAKNTYPLVTSKDVTSGRLQFDLCKHISEQDYLQIIKRSMVDVGDVLMPMIGTVGFPVVVKNDCQFAIKNLALFKTANSNKIDTSFLNYFLQSQECDTQFSLESRGGVQNFVSLGTLRDLGFSNPPILEQRTIANFLDHETAKIDTLMEQQQQLIQLLKEKRQAVISHAVTKGLNPNAPMKDSGVEWLGEVPEHWGVKKLKFACSLISKKISTEQKNVIALENIESWTGKYIDTASEYSGEDVGFVKDDILFGKLRPYLAKVFQAKDEGVAFGDLIVFRPVALLSDFCFYLMISEGFITTVDSSTYGSKMPRASVEFIAEMFVAVPPQKEQAEIVRYIQSKLVKFDNVEAEATSAIQLMQERRTALISAAVTGKIDVRHFVLDDGQLTNQANPQGAKA